MEMFVYALFEEISDQYGTSRLVGIYETKELAFSNAPTTRRSHVQVFQLNGKPIKDADYVRNENA